PGCAPASRIASRAGRGAVTSVLLPTAPAPPRPAARAANQRRTRYRWRWLPSRVGGAASTSTLCGGGRNKLMQHYALPHALPRRGLLAGLRRLVFGDRIKRAQVTDHGAFIRGIGRAWAVPMTLVFSTGALITLGQKQLGEIVAALQHHQTPNYVTV